MRRTLLAFALAGLTLVALAGPASAHVTVSPKTATRGGFATLTFQVPNEKDNATTLKLSVQFPQDHPISQASLKPVPGWKATMTHVKLTTPVTTDDGDTLSESVGTITWEANDGRGVGVGEFQQFLVSVGLPDADSLTFPATQTYSDGSVVRWVETTVPGGPEPEHPAPVLTLTSASATDTAAAATATATAAKSDDSDTAKTIAIVGLIVAAIALAAGVGALVTRKKDRDLSTQQ